MSSKPCTAGCLNTDVMKVGRLLAAADQCHSPGDVRFVRHMQTWLQATHCIPQSVASVANELAAAPNQRNNTFEWTRTLGTIAHELPPGRAGRRKCRQPTLSILIDQRRTSYYEIPMEHTSAHTLQQYVTLQCARHVPRHLAGLQLRAAACTHSIYVGCLKRKRRQTAR
jgi:hypothetical protein